MGGGTGAAGKASAVGGMELRACGEGSTPLVTTVAGGAGSGASEQQQCGGASASSWYNRRQPLG